jgi:hypothetical protein
MLVAPDGGTRTVGMVAINAIPTADPDVFKVAVALPTPMIDTDASGKTAGSVSIGTQAMNGLWSMGALSFIDLNGSYKDIRINKTAQNAQTVLPVLTATYHLAPGANKLWSGPFDVTVTDLAHRDPYNIYSIGTLRMHGTVSDLDMDIQKQMANKNASGGDPMSAALDFFTKLFDKADATVDAQNVVWQFPQSTGPFRAGTLKTSSVKMDLNAIRSGLATAALEGVAQGFAFTDPAYTAMAPTQVSFKGRGEKLPFAQIMLAPTSQGAQAAMQKAGSHLMIDNGVIDAATYGATLKGDLTASPGSSMGTGTLNLSVRGTDTLLSALAGAPSQNAQNAAAVLTVVQMTGKPGTDAQGRPVRSYDLAFAPDGRMTMNGADISALLQGLAAAKGAATPAAPHSTK